MHAEDVALIPQCIGCDAYWLPGDQDRWQARLGCEEDLDGPAVLVFYLPAMRRAREFG
jgi:hypothetical protein